MRDKPNMLFILPYLPYPLTTGGHQALFSGLMALKDDVNIVITYEGWDDEDRTDDISKIKKWLGNIVVIPFIKSRPAKDPEPDILRKTYIHGWFLKEWLVKTFHLSDRFDKDTYIIPSSEFKPKDEARASFINRIIDEYDIDIVECDMLQTASYVHNMPSRLKKIFVHHELGFVREELTVLSQTKHPEAYKGDLARYKANEIRLLNKFDTVVTLSSIDTQKLKDAGVTSPILTSFATVNTRPSPLEASGDHHILSFIGPDCHYPNFVGINWFLDNCWKALRSKDSTYKLRIIGHWDESNKKAIRRKYKGIEFPGYVENLSSSLKNTIQIVPLTIGSGIRMKIIESSSLGIPVVSTSIGAEGIPLISGKHCIIADTPQAFVAGIVKLQDDSTYRTMSESLFNDIATLFSAEELKKNRLKLVQLPKYEF